MKNVGMFTFVFLLCTISLQAQERDSILTDYIQKAQYKQAIEFLETLQESHPNDISILSDLAKCYEERLQYSKSIRCYENLIALDSANAFFHVRKADLLYRSEKYKDALDGYFRIDTEKYNPTYLKKSIAMCYEKLNQPDSAKIYYEEAYTMDIEDIFSALSLVKILIQQENYPTALQHSELFLSNDSTNGQMNALNAYTYYCLNDYDEAVKRFEKCRVAGDSSQMVNRSLGISYYFLQNDTAAYPYLQQAYARDTTNRTLLYALASVNHNLGHYPQAIQNYEALIEQTIPHNNTLYTYYNGLAQSYEKDSLFGDAVRNYVIANRYASTNRQKMDNSFALAMLLEFDLKDYKTAVFYYTQYRATLANHEESLLEQENPELDKIKEIQLKINELDKHLRNLKEEHGINYNDKIWSN